MRTLQHEISSDVALMVSIRVKTKSQTFVRDQLGAIPTPTTRAAVQQHKPDHTLSISQDTLSLQAAIKYRIELSVVLVVLPLALVIQHNTEVALQVGIFKHKDYSKCTYLEMRTLRATSWSEKKRVQE